MDASEFDNSGGDGGSGGPEVAVVVAAAAVLVVDNRDGVQWWQWCGHLMAAAGLVATFNGSSVGQQQGRGRCRCNNQIEVTKEVGGNIGRWCLTVTIGDGVGWCQQWTMTTQQATKCGNCKKVTIGCGGSHSNDSNSKEQVVEENGGNGNGNAMVVVIRVEMTKVVLRIIRQQQQWALLDATFYSQC